jgi:expansin (peptidoglycan-binding protein)
MVTITSSNMNSGTGTFFANGLGACGPTNSGSELVVALSRDLFATLADSKASSACGRRILATGPKGAITVTVSDQCETCDKFDLDFSQGAFTRIADPAAGRVPIEWSFLD